MLRFSDRPRAGVGKILGRTQVKDAGLSEAAWSSHAAVCANRTVASIPLSLRDVARSPSIDLHNRPCGDQPHAELRRHVVAKDRVFAFAFRLDDAQQHFA